MDNLYYEKLQKESEQALNLDSFNPNEWAEKIVRTVNETEEEFIFSTIKPFINSITNMVIPKEELVRAISLIRLQREASERYGSIISNDWDTAVRQMVELRSAYDRGFRDGVEKCRERLNNVNEVIDDE